MRLYDSRLARIPWQRLAFGLALLGLAAAPVRACTIFVLTDTNRTLFCNNEAGTKTNTRVWFQPAGDGYFAAAYVGYDDGFPQGGLNSQGLAYDWVAGYLDNWEPDPKLPLATGNSCQRMLETCATVPEAIAFYRAHREPAFWHARILVADKTGASVIIGADHTNLLVQAETHCRGLGYGQKTFEAALATNPEPTVANGFKILCACRQTGQYTTRYSNLYDLKTGDIYLLPIPGPDEAVKLNLAAELKKGPHFYDLPKLREQLAEEPRTLPYQFDRFPVDGFKPIPDLEPAVTDHVRRMIQDSMDGTMRSEDYAEGMWKIVSLKAKEIRDTARRIGPLGSMTLVDRTEHDGQRSYRYRLDCANAIVLDHLSFDAQNKIVGAFVEGIQWKPGAEGFTGPHFGTAGIGTGLGVEGDYIIVKFIVPDSPAAANKDIHAGDRIVAVAQDTGPAVPVRSGNLAQAVSLIRGPKGSTVRLTLAAADEDESKARVVSLVRDELEALGR